MRYTAGNGMPAAPAPNSAAGLRSKSSSAVFAPGTGPCGTSGITVIRSGSAGRDAGSE